MAGLDRRRLRLVVISALVSTLGAFVISALTADATARKVTADVCALVRAEIIAVLVPQASAPTTFGGTDETIRYSGCQVEGPGVKLVWIVAHFGRGEHGRPDRSAHWWIGSLGSCFRCDERPTPRRIGNESFEYGREVSVDVWARLGATGIQVRYETGKASESGMFEAARTVAQEVASRCPAC